MASAAGVRGRRREDAPAELKATAPWPLPAWLVPPVSWRRAGTGRGQRGWEREGEGEGRERPGGREEKEKNLTYGSHMDPIEDEI